MFLLDGRPVFCVPLFIARDKRSAWHDNYLRSRRTHMLWVLWWAGTWEALANWILTTTWCDRACVYPGFLNERERKVFRNTFEIIISPIERNFIKHFAVSDLLTFGKKISQGFGKPPNWYPYLPTKYKHRGLQRRWSSWEAWSGGGLGSARKCPPPPSSHTCTDPGQGRHQKCDKSGSLLGACGQPRLWILNLSIPSYS